MINLEYIFKFDCLILFEFFVQLDKRIQFLLRKCFMNSVYVINSMEFLEF